MAAGYFGILELQGILPLQSAPVVPKPAAGYFGLLDLQGLWVLVPGAVVNKVQDKKCNWGSWCRRNTRIVP